ncbi:unnamed protein product [Somion occarium]|uniref:J domain-containing protein n=1 Tax=Somion occarium TaxID=3059160 RepID=A0ABP1CVQ4_9APHY
MATSEEETNPYELLGVTLESSEAEIKTAYRQRSLKVHPDRNRGNPDAARKFHELNQAYELLLDPLRRMALDAKVRIKEARKARYAQYDHKRRNLVEELEERERAFKRSKMEKEAKQKEMWRENERVMEEGRLMREAREKELRKREEEVMEEARKAKERTSELEPPPVGTLDTTVRVKYTLSTHPELTTAEQLSALLRPFGVTDISDILISLKPSPPKKPKRGTAIVPFKQIGDAFAAVCASGREERGLKDVEITWAEGKESGLIEWLKKMGQLGSNGVTPSRFSATSTASSPATSPTQPSGEPDSTSTPFSSFPSTFVSCPRYILMNGNDLACSIAGPPRRFIVHSN